MTAVTSAGPTSRSSLGSSRDLGTVLFSLWLIVGLFLDGYMHNTRGGELESFFTPWHGVLYSGFLATAAWLVLPALHERAPGIGRRLAALPAGYRLGVLGVVIFGIGGVVDGVWHSLLGIEVDLEALISPAHLILFTGALLIVTTPLRSAWASREATPSLRAFLPALASTTLGAALIGFFFMYASGLYDLHGTTGFTNFLAERYPGDHALTEITTAHGLLARLLTTVILMAPALLLVRRWRTPKGTFTIFFGAYATFMLVLEEFSWPLRVVVAVLSGVVADLLASRLRPGMERPAALRVFAAAVPVVLWLLHFAAVAATDGLGWGVVLWGGMVFFGGLTGLALSVLALPPAIPAAPAVD